MRLTSSSSFVIATLAVSNSLPSLGAPAGGLADRSFDADSLEARFIPEASFNALEARGGGLLDGLSGALGGLPLLGPIVSGLLGAVKSTACGTSVASIEEVGDSNIDSQLQALEFGVQAYQQLFEIYRRKAQFSDGDDEDGEDGEDGEDDESSPTPTSTFDSSTTPTPSSDSFQYVASPDAPPTMDSSAEPSSPSETSTPIESDPPSAASVTIDMDSPLVPIGAPSTPIDGQKHPLDVMPVDPSLPHTDPMSPVGSKIPINSGDPSVPSVPNVPVTQPSAKLPEAPPATPGLPVTPPSLPVDKDKLPASAPQPQMPTVMSDDQGEQVSELRVVGLN